MRNNQRKSHSSHDGFVALIGVIFFSAILCLALFIQVERLRALEMQFENATSQARTTTAAISCAAINTITKPTAFTYSNGQPISIDFSALLSSSTSLTAIATSCIAN